VVNDYDEPRPWTIEDSLELSRLARTGAVLMRDLTLPSGRVLAADEANELLEAERARREAAE
jgi:hypothetical protein